MFLLDIIENYDLFKVSPQFNILGKASVSTKETMIVSSIVYILSIIVILFNFISTYTSNSPIYVAQETIRDLKTTENITLETLNFAFGFYSHLNTNKENLNKVELTKLQLISNSSLENEDFSIKSSQKLFNSEYIENISNVGNLTDQCDLINTNKLLDAMICLNFHKNYSLVESESKKVNKEIISKINKVIPNEDGVLKLGSSVLESGFHIDTNLLINFSPCFLKGNNDDLDLEKSNYREMEKLKKPNLSDTLKNSYHQKCWDNFINADFNDHFQFTFVYETDLPAPGDYNNGFIKYNNTKSIVYNPKVENLIVKINLIKQTMNTDYGIIFSFGPFVNRIFYKKEISLEVVDKDNTLNREIQIEFQITIDDEIIIIERSYTQIDNLLASCFSLIDLFIMVGSVFGSYFNSNNVEYQIINKLYYSSIDNSRIKKNHVSSLLESSRKKFDIDNNKLNNESSDREIHSQIYGLKVVSNNKISQIKINNIDCTINDKLDNINEINKNKINLSKENLEINENKLDKVENEQDNITLKNKNNELAQSNFSNDMIASSDQIKQNFNNFKHLNNIKCSNLNILKENELVKEKEDSNVYFNYSSGIKDQISELFYSFFGNSDKTKIDFKHKAVELVSKELDITVILSKLIQHESIINILESNCFGEISRFRNINCIDEILEKMQIA